MTDPADKAQDDVDELHKEVREIARMLLGQRTIDEESGAVEPDTSAIGKAGDLLLNVAKQKSSNAGLDKRHATKVQVSPAPSVDEWVKSLESK